MRKFFQAYLFLIVATCTLLILDQATKLAARTFLVPDDTQLIAGWLFPYLYLTLQFNPGAALGSFVGFGIAFKILAVAVSAAILYYFPRIPKENRMLRISLAITLAGVLGNLIDRLLWNDTVTDFLAIGNFAVINLADACIWLGIILLVITLVFREDEKPQAQPAAPAIPSPEQSNNESDPQMR